METVYCGLCGKKIEIKTDNYAKLIDYKKGKEHGVGYYHSKCYVDTLRNKLDKDKEVMKKMTFNLLSRANKMMAESGY